MFAFLLHMYCFFLKTYFLAQVYYYQVLLRVIKPGECSYIVMLSSFTFSHLFSVFLNM